jgi:hypothetical protein
MRDADYTATELKSIGVQAKELLEAGVCVCVYYICDPAFIFRVRVAGVRAEGRWIYGFAVVQERSHIEPAAGNRFEIQYARVSRKATRRLVPSVPQGSRRTKCRKPRNSTA